MLSHFLDLVRVPLTLTAAADSFTGYCLAAQLRGLRPSAVDALCVVASSILVYWLGMATNDLFDLEKDRRGGVRRPLATGALDPFSALLFSMALGLGAVAAALLVSPLQALGTLAIILLAIAYNSGGKHLPILGNLIMGSCRSGNLLLGALAVIPPSEIREEPALWSAALLLGVYIAWVTAASLLEDRRPDRRSFLATTLPILLAPVAIVATGPWSLAALGNGALFLAILARGIVRGARACTAASAGAPPPLPGAGAPAGESPPPAPPAPHPAALFVRTGLSGIFPADAGFLLREGVHSAALAVWGLWILTWLWKRRWLQSPP